MSEIKKQAVTIDWPTECINENQPFKITSKGKVLHFDENEETLRRWGSLDEDEEIVDEFYLPSLATYHTTDSLRFAFDDLYPGESFDDEFRTNEPGVFQRIIESGYGELFDKANELKLKALEKVLDERGYTLE